MSKTSETLLNVAIENLDQLNCQYILITIIDQKNGSENTTMRVHNFSTKRCVLGALEVAKNMANEKE